MPCVSDIISDNYSYYLSTLKDLIAMPSVFTDPAGIKQAIHHCRDMLAQNLPGWHVYFDAKHNLIARPKTIDTEKDASRKQACLFRAQTRQPALQNDPRGLSKHGIESWRGTQFWGGARIDCQIQGPLPCGPHADPQQSVL